MLRLLLNRFRIVRMMRYLRYGNDHNMARISLKLYFFISNMLSRSVALIVEEVVAALAIVTRIVMVIRERRTAVLIVIMAGVVKWLLDRKSNNFLILNSLMRPKFHHF